MDVDLSVHGSVREGLALTDAFKFKQPLFRQILQIILDDDNRFFP